MKNRFIHYALVLGVIAAVTSGILSVVNKKTLVVIKQNEIKAINEARRMVLPKAVTFKEENKITTNSSYEFIPGYGEGDRLVGYVVNFSEPGYAANIDCVMGVDRRGRVTGLNIIGSQETPGLGSKILDPEWQKKAIGRDSSYEFTKADAFAGATISPQAVYTGIKKVLTSFDSEVKK